MYVVALIYISLRSFIATLYDWDIVFGFSALEVSGFLFPVSLLLWWVHTGSPHFTSKVVLFYTLFFLWVTVITFLKVIDGANLIYSASFFFRLLNGYCAFLFFPFLFDDYKKIQYLLLAYSFSLIFPFLQGLIQFFYSPTFLGMTTSFTRGDTGPDIIMYHGLYHKYDGYAWASLLAAMLAIYYLPTVQPKKQKYFVLVVLFSWFLATLTLSRLLLILILFVTVSYFFILRRDNIFFYIFVPAVILFAILLGTRFEQLSLRSESEISVVTGDKDISAGLHGRVDLWQNSYAKFSTLPLQKQMFGSQIDIGPHGDYVTWLLEYGYIGLFFYITLFLLFVYQVSVWLYMVSKYSSFRLFFFLSKFGFMVLISLFVWLMSAWVHNPSSYPDYSYFILGNVGIFLYHARKAVQSHPFRPHTSSVHGPQHRYRDHPQIKTLI